MKAPGEELLGKLWVTLVDNGVGGLLRPWQIRREAQAKLEAKANEVVAMAVAEKRAKEIASDNVESDYNLEGGEFDLLSGRAEPKISEEGVARIARDMALNDFVRRERNVAKAILVAEKELLEFEGDVTDEQIEEDWIHRWRNLAGEVGAEKLQYLWGQILAGETKAPGQYSLRTLDFLKNISQEEARNIESIAPFIISGRIIKDAEGFPDGFGLSHDVLLYLQGIGVLSSVDSLTISAQWGSVVAEKFIRPLISGNKVLVVNKEDPRAILSVPAIVVTEIGRQVLSLVKSAPNEEYLLAVGRKIKARGFEVRMANVTKVDSSWLEYDDAVDVE
ncbi:DUF2806 domain-containing protein [Pseudomonas oryzihabitans]|uniref:DUF2806 domain-containing protein n=1 Tax=Pseudomonas oryzihabitans TaxID=47885 RepID=UPI00241E623A|nr:DUF2806 domain-containing protein [Pseudomonas oryzihabitans]